MNCTVHTVAKYDLLVLTRRSFVKLPEAGVLFGLRPSAFPVTNERADKVPPAMHRKHICIQHIIKKS